MRTGLSSSEEARSGGFVASDLRLLRESAADELAVLDGTGWVIGLVSERRARRRYFEEMEAAQSEIFGEI